MSILSDLPSYAFQMNGEDYQQWEQPYFSTVDQNMQSSQEDQWNDTTDIFPYDNWNDSPQNACESFEMGPTWDAQPIVGMCGMESQSHNSSYDAMTTLMEPHQQNNQLQIENAKLKVDLGACKKRIEEVEEQFNEFQRWTAQVSRVMNDLQLQVEGLAPLQKQFGYVMSSPAKKSKAGMKGRRIEDRREDEKHGTSAQ